jgi:hypothetical protein
MLSMSSMAVARLSPAISEVSGNKCYKKGENATDHTKILTWNHSICFINFAKV